MKPERSIPRFMIDNGGNETMATNPAEYKELFRLRYRATEMSISKGFAQVRQNLMGQIIVGPKGPTVPKGTTSVAAPDAQPEESQPEDRREVPDCELHDENPESELDPLAGDSPMSPHAAASDNTNDDTKPWPQRLAKEFKKNHRIDDLK